jgi:hypothetical protein
MIIFTSTILCIILFCILCLWNNLKQHKETTHEPYTTECLCGNIAPHCFSSCFQGYCKTHYGVHCTCSPKDCDNVLNSKMSQQIDQLIIKEKRTNLLP